MIDAPVARIADEAKMISSHVPGTTWYLFGSILTSPESANDIDLLVIHAREDDGPTIREALSSLCIGLPLHLMIVSEAEEHELDIRGRYHLRQIFPPA